VSTVSTVEQATVTRDSHTLEAAQRTALVALIEPDGLLRALLVRLLKGAGYIPVPVALGPGAIGDLPAGAAAVVLDSDDLPDPALAALPPIPTILLTSVPMTAPHPAGRVEVVEKPFLADEFLDALARLVGPYAS
jgi:hypothetical protein